MWDQMRISKHTQGVCRDMQAISLLLSLGFQAVLVPFSKLGSEGSVYNKVALCVSFVLLNEFGFVEESCGVGFHVFSKLASITPL